MDLILSPLLTPVSNTNSSLHPIGLISKWCKHDLAECQWPLIFEWKWDFLLYFSGLRPRTLKLHENIRSGKNLISSDLALVPKRSLQNSISLPKLTLTYVKMLKLTQIVSSTLKTSDYVHRSTRQAWNRELNHRQQEWEMRLSIQNFNDARE